MSPLSFGPPRGHHQKDLEDAAERLTEQLNRAFTALGDTIRDPEAKEDLTEAVKALGDAVSVTVAETGEYRSNAHTPPRDVAGCGAVHPCLSPVCAGWSSRAGH
jgi:hypothetical protein